MTHLDRLGVPGQPRNFPYDFAASVHKMRVLDHDLELDSLVVREKPGVRHCADNDEDVLLPVVDAGTATAVAAFRLEELGGNL